MPDPDRSTLVHGAGLPVLLRLGDVGLHQRSGDLEARLLPGNDIPTARQRPRLSALVIRLTAAPEEVAFHRLIWGRRLLVLAKQSRQYAHGTERFLLALGFDFNPELHIPARI